MWTSTYSKVFKSVKKEAIWQRWSDVNSWHEWVPNIESCKLDKPFLSGSSFTLKPKGSPAVTVELLNVKRDQTFTGCTRFFGATMYDIHEMHQDPQGIRLTVTLKVTGPLGFLWRKLVAEKIEANLPTLLRNLAAAVGAPESKNPALLHKPNLTILPKPKLQLISSQPQKQKPKSKKAKSKKSTAKPKKTNPLLQSIPHESAISNRKVANSMTTATNLKLSTPAAKATPANKTKTKAKAKPKSKTSAIKKTKPKTKATPAKKTAVKKTTAKKTTDKKTTAKKAAPKSKIKTKAKAATSATKKKTTKPTAKKTTAKKAAPKSKPKTKAKAKAKAK